MKTSTRKNVFVNARAKPIRVFPSVAPVAVVGARLVCRALALAPLARAARAGGEHVGEHRGRPPAAASVAQIVPH